MSGALGFLGVGVEDATGTNAGSAVIDDFVPITGETLRVTPTPLFSQGIRALWDEQKAYNGLQSVAGNVAMEIDPNAIGYFLWSWFGATSVSLGTAAGVAWSNLCASHATVRAHYFIAKQDQFQAGSGSDVPTLTLLAYRGPALSTGSAFCYYNNGANTMEIVVEAGALSRASFDFLGREYSRLDRPTPSFAPVEGLLWNQASVSLNAAGSSIFESLTIRGDNRLEAVPNLDRRLRPNLIKRNNFRTIEISGNLSFRDDTDYDRFVGGSEMPLAITFVGEAFPGAAGSGHNYKFKIEAPAFRYTTFQGPNISGPGRISIPFGGRAMWHVGSGTALAFTLVNTRTTAYNVNSF